MYYDVIASYSNPIYYPFNNSLPDILAVLAGVKPLARLSCQQADDYLNFAKWALENNLYFIKGRHKDELKLFIFYF